MVPLVVELCDMLTDHSLQCAIESLDHAVTLGMMVVVVSFIIPSKEHESKLVV